MVSQTPLHMTDRRAQVLVSQALTDRKAPTHPLFAAIRRVQQFHPETCSAINELLQQFGSLSLKCDQESIPINRLVAQEMSPVLEHAGADFDLTQFAPRTIRLVLQLFENKKIPKDELLSFAPELLAIGDQLQIEQVTDVLIATRKEFERIAPEDFKALLAHAKNHNFIFYVGLLGFAAANPPYKQQLSKEELEVVNHANFKSISSGRQISISLNESGALTLYAKMCVVRRSMAADSFTAVIYPPQGKTVSFLKAVKKVLNESSWPNQVQFVSIDQAQALKDFLILPQKSGQLTGLEFSSCTVSDQLFESLPQNLRTLGFKDCKLTNHDAQMLAKYLAAYTALQTLSLEKNSISAVGLAFVVSALKHPISTLNLSENSLDAQAIDLLRPIVTERLILSKNPLGDAGAERLASMLCDPHPIEHLTLSECGIGNAGIRTICRALCQNPLLYSLHLNANPFTSDALGALCELLANGITLTHLDLTKTALTPRDICTLAEQLKQNRQLARLTLAETEVTDEVCKALSQMLRDNQALSVLSVRSTKITDQGAKLLVAAIEAKEQFELSLAFNSLSGELKTELKENPKVILG